jgi:flagellar hook-associated protein 1 FlgK
VSLTAALNIGSNGLAAATQGTSVASQNISNAATEGYTRRITNLEPIPLGQGGGVRATASTRVQDAFLERRSLSASAFSGESAARAQTLSVLDQVLADGQGSVGQALDGFETAMADFSAHPNESGARNTLLQSAGQLTQAFNRAADQLTAARVDANGQISASVADVNQKLQQIGALGGQIVAAKIQGKEAGDLEDQRDQLVRQVAQALPVNVLAEANGAITLQLSGQRTLVAADGSVHPLQATPDPTTGDVRIFRTTSGAPEDVTGLISSGSIGGTIAARDGALADARTQLDQLASDVATAYNVQHRAGFGLDGVTGRNLFTPPVSVTGAAGSMSVSTDVAGLPNNLAAASSATSLPGDNRNALSMLALRDQKLALGGTATAQEAFSSLIASSGSALRTAKDQQTQADAALSQIDSLRQSVSGVSTDEEMISLMRFQRAYQASLRVVETADAMLSDLLNMKRTP